MTEQHTPSRRLYLGVHGGILRSEAVLATEPGVVLARVTGIGMSPRRVGVGTAVAEIARLYHAALEIAGLPSETAVQRLAAIVADVDLPFERTALRDALEQRFETSDLIVENDVHGVLWAGMRRPAGVAIICDSGINAIARAATGRRAEYLALGRISGDWGGALELGREILFAAQRSEDGRGPRTRLQYEVAAHFRTRTVSEAIVEYHLSATKDAELEGLARRLLAIDETGDEVAGALVDRVASEVVTMAVSAGQRVRLPATGADVVLSGWVLNSGHTRLDRLVDDGFERRMPGASVVRYDQPLVIGAVLACFGAERGGPLRSEGTALATAIASMPAQEVGDERRPGSGQERTSTGRMSEVPT